MEPNGNKCVMGIGEWLPFSVMANTAGIKGLSLGKYIPETIGPEAPDKSGCAHLGLIRIPAPVLGVDRRKVKEPRRLCQPESYPAGTNNKRTDFFPSVIMKAAEIGP